MVTRKIKHKNPDGTVTEADIGVLAENVQTDTERQFVSGEEKEKWNEITSVKEQVEKYTEITVSGEVLTLPVSGNISVNNEILSMPLKL